MIWETYAIKLALNRRLWIPWHFNSFKRNNSLGLQSGENLMQISAQSIVTTLFVQQNSIIC